MRTLSFERNVLKNPAGSCLVSFGSTRVMCSAIVEASVPPFLRNTGKGWITAEYAMLPGSTPGGRKRREIGKRDGRSTEIQRLVGRSLRAAVDMAALGEISIMIDCDVLDADGGTRTAAITGGWVALYDALTELAGLQGTSGPDHYLLGQIAAVSVGIVDGEVICDLDYAHDSRADVDMNIVKRDNSLVEVQGTGEKATFSRDQLLDLLDAADKGIAEIFAAQRAVLGLSAE
ncbi:MAG: ribonuclease PH [Spirochaetales bacterium]|nr:MAG: ribonuclease PH [Spirochaetales bacterium]